MATKNPFDLLGDDDNDNPSLLIATQQHKIAVTVKKPAAVAPPVKLPSKPLPPAQAVREARGGRGRAGPGGYGGDGEVGGAPERDRGSYGAPRESFRGGRRGGYGNGEAGGEALRRVYERRSGTGHGYEMKREGAGRGNWGVATDDALLQETKDNIKTDKIATLEKHSEQEDAQALGASKDVKEGQLKEAEEKEDKEMTLEEYEKIREEKRKALLAMKTEERKVDLDKELESMQQLSLKKGDDVFIKLGSDKDGKKKENVDRDERAKKPVSINMFLKPAEGERNYSPGVRGRGRGQGGGFGSRGASRGEFGGVGLNAPAAAAPSIEDPGHFPTLGVK